MNASRVIALVLGSIVSLVALALVAAGGAMAWFGWVETDDDGFIGTSAKPFVTSTYALASDDMDVHVGEAEWLVDRDVLGTVRVVVTPESDDPVFVGIASEADVDAYLAGVEHEVVTDVDYEPFSYDAERRSGGAPAQAPTEVSFWAASAAGTGEQSFRWDVDDGDWRLVLMNADGSRGVDADLEVGARIGWLGWVGLVVLAGGLGLLGGGAALIWVGGRGVRPPAPVAEALPH